MRFTRRRFVQAAGAAIGISSTGISFGQTNPIRLGLMTVKTGPLAWPGVLAWWIPLVAFGAWLVTAAVLTIQAAGREPQPTPTDLIARVATAS